MRTKQIANDYNIKVINITKRNIDKYANAYDIEKGDLKNNAYVIGDDEIILGLYDDDDLKFAAFFHEIGHTLVTESFSEMINYDMMLIEYQAWIEGLKVAKKYGYRFKNKTFKYILKSINSYYKDALGVYNKDNKLCRRNLQPKSNSVLRIRKILPNLM
jgi:hypothetical protein